METRDIVELLNLVAARDISELEVEREGFRLRIVRAGLTPATVVVEESARGASPMGAPVVRRVVENPPAARAEAAPGPSAVVEEGFHVMRTPIVGTFYRSASPAAEPLAKVGDHVKRGQVLCIVEAMKLMNEIESEIPGIVVEILVEDGQPVEYGEPLFKLRPDK